VRARPETFVTQVFISHRERSMQSWGCGSFPSCCRTRIKMQDGGLVFAILLLNGRTHLPLLCFNEPASSLISRTTSMLGWEAYRPKSKMEKSRWELTKRKLGANGYTFKYFQSNPAMMCCRYRLENNSSNTEPGQGINAFGSFEAQYTIRPGRMF